ncbi:MFS transporter [Streptomyces sp. B4I13]|uniref:MFS transporter n=1 Tax=Streptomyces sp. B4I13 TaxID=3042271 RepID=UPI0027D79FD5|nr:MFS transporter [Streptomyces sp. B4I13]
MSQAPNLAAPPRRTGVLIALLGALTAVAPLATDMYVPGFPEMGRTLRASDSAVQLSMTSFLAGLVIGQLLIGPLSDRLGRRRLLMPGTALFAVLPLACAVAPTAEVLTAARFLQGVAGAAGMVLARAMTAPVGDAPETSGRGQAVRWQSAQSTRTSLHPWLRGRLDCGCWRRKGTICPNLT